MILAPSTLDGPSSTIGEFGGAAVSQDGSGGVVYTKQIAGVQHVFAAQYRGGRWLPPVRVDWQSPYGATYPRIAAAEDGWLVVVWVSQIATVKGRIQDALYSSTLEPGAETFGEEFIVDPNVGEGQGVDPSLALAANGQGLVAYRVVTNNFTTSLIQTTIPQLRPGDVLADIRVADYNGQLWSSPVRVDRDPRLTTRPPNESNGPQVGIGRGDEAVVAWQEPESSGVARIWARRLFGSTLGLAMQVSPTSYGGRPVTADANAFSLAVSEFGQATVVSRVASTAGASTGHAGLFISALPVSSAPKGGQFTAARPLAAASSPAQGTVGVPSVAVDDQGEYRVAFSAGSLAEVLTGEERGLPIAEARLGFATTTPGAAAVTALSPGGGGVTAWPTSGAGGLSVIAVREDFSDGAAQEGLISGAIDGPISQLAIGGSESGEALLGAREGSPGAYEIVATRITVPPPALYLEVPTGWVRPARARFSWSDAEDATGGVSYALVVDGRVVQRGIHGLSVLSDRRLLGSGVRHVQILATDASRQQRLSGEGELKVDGSAPVARVRHVRGREVVVRVKDAQSGAVAKATSISFGDGTRVRGRLTARHTYARAGRFVIVVEMRDKVGNSGSAHLRVMVE